MKYLIQMCIITGITFAGELLRAALPFPVPGSVYGMAILFLCLSTGLIKVKQIEETAEFLLAIMPVLFVGPGVGILENYTHVTGNLPIFLLTVAVSTALVMGATGAAVQAVMAIKRRRDGRDE